MIGTLFLTLYAYLPMTQGVSIIGNSFGISNSNPQADSTINNVFNSSISNSKNENKWINVSGMWSLDEMGLNGGPSSNGSVLPTNILLNPHNHDNPSSISTTFRINELNPETSNYASIIYRFQDPDNYSYGGINILNNKVYAIFGDFNNGILESQPQWPGFDTGLMFTPNSIFNMSIVKSSEGLDLLLNGSSLYKSTKQIDSNPKYIGLHYGNVKNISFLTFSSTSDQQSLEESYPLSDSQTIRLNDKELSENNYILLYDSSPYIIAKGNIDATLPCNENNSTDINVLQGNETAYQAITMNYVPSSYLESDDCQFKGIIQSNQTNPANMIFLQNNSTDDIEFSYNSVIFVKINEVSRHMNEGR